MTLGMQAVARWRGTPPSTTFNRLEGAFLGASEPIKLTNGTVPDGLYRYLYIDWFNVGSTLTAIKARHPTSQILAYQGLAGMRIGPHSSQPSTLVTQEEAVAHGVGTDSWFLHTETPAAATITTATNVTPPVFTTSAAHGLSLGSGDPDWVELSGTSRAAYNGFWKVNTIPSSTTVTFKNANNTVMAGSGTSSGGTIKKLVRFSDFPELFAANVSKTTWRTQARNHLATILANGFHGVMLDDVNTFPGHGFNEGEANDSTEFATDNAYRDALAAAIVDLGGYAETIGCVMAANVAGDPWNAAHRAGFTAMLPGLTVWNRESYHSWSAPISTIPFVGSPYADLQAMVAEAEAAGVASSLEANPLNPVDHTRMLRFGLAAFFMEWGVVGQPLTDSAYAYNNGEPFSEILNYRELIGVPTEAKQLISGTSTDGAWMRHWTDGVACINAKTTAGLVTFTLGGTYLNPAGTGVTSVQLNSGEGMVLLTP